MVSAGADFKDFLYFMNYLDGLELDFRNWQTNQSARYMGRLRFKTQGLMEPVVLDVLGLSAMCGGNRKHVITYGQIGHLKLELRIIETPSLNLNW